MIDCSLNINKNYSYCYLTTYEQVKYEFTHNNILGFSLIDTLIVMIFFAIFTVLIYWIFIRWMKK